MKKIKCKLDAQYDGHTIKNNGDVDLKFKLPYSEITSALLLTQMINTNINIIAKVGKRKPTSLGTFVIKNLNIDRDGETKIKFNSEVDTAEVANFIDLTEQETIIKLKCEASIESEIDLEGDDDDDDE